jgi:hypothetical protein
MLRQGDRLLPSRRGCAVAWIVTAEQLHQGSSQLLGSATGPLALEGVPVAVANHQLPLQFLRQWSCGLRPGVGGGSRLGNHWTLGQGSFHPGECVSVMGSVPPSPRQRPVRLLHLLDGIFTQASLAGRSSGVAGRRQRQRLVLSQRLLDPLPRELAPADHSSQLFWRGLRWGGLGLLLAWLLRP